MYRVRWRDTPNASASLSLSYEQPELINVAPGESVSTPVQINNVDLSAVHSDDHAARSVSVVAASGEVQPAVRKFLIARVAEMRGR